MFYIWIGIGVKGGYICQNSWNSTLNFHFSACKSHLNELKSFALGHKDTSGNLNPDLFNATGQFHQFIVEPGAPGNAPILLKHLTKKPK